jgi:hypothetical protein
VQRFGREHNERVAADLRAFALETGLADERLTQTVAQLAVEVGDRIFQLAFAEKVTGDPELVEEGIVLVTSYLDRYATAKGRKGVTQ